MSRFLFILIFLTSILTFKGFGQCAISFSSVAVTDATCFGNCDGELSVVVAGATGNVNYTWKDSSGSNLGVNNDTITGLCTGTYQLSVIDGNNCTKDTLFTISSSPEVIATVTRTNTTCSGNTGELSVNGSGGCGGPYQYSINGGAFQSSGVFSNLTVGFYTIVTQDNCGCSDTIVDYVSATNGPLVASLNYVEPLCNGSNNGSITVFAFGTNPIQYSIDGGVNFSSNNAFTNLSPGIYQVAIQDGAGCQSLGVVEMTEPTLIVPNSSVINETCALNDGQITLTQSGGVTPFQYSIDNGTTFQSSNMFSGLNGGMYHYVIMDANGCSATDSVSLSTGQGPTIVDSTIIQPSCSNICNGSIQLSVNGINTPFTYTINGNSNADTSFQNLCIGNQSIIVADANNCQTTFSTTLTAPTAPTSTFSVSDSIDIAPLTVSFTNSSSNASNYQWLFGDSTASDTTMNTSYTYTDSGSYTVTLIAFNQGCVDSSFATIVITGEPGLTMPNVFTPNNDGVNDVFRPITIGVSSMEMTIYNRWGEIVTKVNGSKGYWDGRTFPSGEICPEGTYFYILTATGIDGKTFEETGTVQLFR